MPAPYVVLMINLDPNQPCLVVGIGASAGGLVAFKSFLSNLPADTGMAFVLVQHLAPNHKSLLVELLAAESPIPVAVASDGLEVKRDCIYVIPPDATLTIKDEVLQVQSPAPTREHRRPIDSFFTSLAEDCGERAVGIVLAGVGSDGTMGIRAIREHGGLTLAQAEFDHHAMSGMPHSAAISGMVDDVMPVEAMPAKLTAYRAHLSEVATKKDGNGHRHDIQEHLAQITSILHARSTHDFSGYKEATLVRRLQRRMQVLHIDTAKVYVERLQTDQSEVGALFCELLIGVTQFFRDPEAFDALNALVIRPLLDAKGDDEPMRVWVPGCSTGEEVYSIAILLRDALRARSRNPEVKIFGTDIDANAIATARRGRYRKADAGLSPERLEQWFVKADDYVTPVQEVRDMCVFSVHSLVKDPPFSRLDLISCRNVMIYLEDAPQDRLMRTFHYALQPGGALFLGTAESVTRNSRLFTAIDKKHRILQRRDVGATLPALQPRGVSPAPQASSAPSMRRRASEDKMDKAVGRLMQQYAPAYFVLDHNQDVVRFSGAETGHYLEPSQGPATFNLFSILHKSLRSAVRVAVRQAVAEGQRVVDDKLTIRIDGRVRALTLIVEPIGGENDAKIGGSCVVAFRDTSVAADATDPASPDRGDADVQMLERELHGTKTQLLMATDELETQLEDMKSTTEEFQAVNEELQSSNEELETSKEEMQSINEELQTINGELASKNEQLLRLNADMQNLLDSTQIATVFLDDQLRIRHFTPALTELFSVRDADRGRPITHFVSDLDYTSVQADVVSVQRDNQIIERDLRLKDGTKSYVMRIQPYRASENVVDGIVITFVDITERKQAERVHARLAAIVTASDAAIVSNDRDGIITSWNSSAERLFGYSAEELIGKSVTILIPDDRSSEDSELRKRLENDERIENFETVRLCRDGSRLEISLAVSPIKDAEGRIIGFSKIARDITERKAIEQKLVVSEENYRTLFDLGPVAVYSCLASGVIQNFNGRAAELWGREPVSGDTDELFCGSHKLIRPDGSVLPHGECPMAEVLSGKISEARDAEILIERPDGSRITVLVNIRPIKNDHGELTGAINCFHDITERKKYEARLAMVSHELQHRSKNLLAVISSIANRTLSAGRTIDDARNAFVDRLAALGNANELLSHSDWRGATLKDVVERTLEPFGTRFSIEGKRVMLNPNATQGFMLVLHELGTNALKHGAFSTSEGTAAISWSIRDNGGAPHLTFRWQERDGPRVTAPASTSFGTTLLQVAIGGLVSPPHIEYAPEGMIFALEVPTATVTAENDEL